MMKSSPICHNCSKKYTQSGPNLPLLLNCGHTFCEQCLAKFCRQIKWSGNINCPDCREETYIEAQKSLKQLPISTHIYGLISAPVRSTEHVIDRLSECEELSNERDVPVKEEEESADEEEDEYPPCIECNATAHADCNQCGFAYCQKCFDTAHKLVALRNHTSKPVQPKALFEQCTEHLTSSPTHYLTLTGAPVCPDCESPGNTKVLVTEPDQIEDLMDKYNVGLEQLTESDQLLNELVPTVEDDFSRLKNDIRREFAYMHGMLQARERDLLVKLEEKLSETIKPLLSLSRDTRECKRGLSQSFNWLHKNKARPRYLLKRQKRVEAIAAEITEAKTSLHVLSEKRPTYIARRDVLITYIKEFSYINTDTVHQYDLVVPNDNLNILRVKEEEPVLDEDDVTWGSNEELEETARQLEVEQSVADSQDLVVVSSVYTPHNLYIQRVQDRDKIDCLQNMLVKYYGLSATSEDYITTVHKGDLVCAKYSADELWYRARVVSAETKDNIKVVYVDYGNEETVGLAQLRQLKHTFTTTPALAIKCSMYDIAPRDGQIWTFDAIEALKRITQDKEFVLVTKTTCGEHYEIDLQGKTGIDSVRELLVFLQHACFSNSGSSTTESVHLEIQPQPWPGSEDGFTGVIVSHIVNPNHFYVQLTNNAADLGTLVAGIVQYTGATTPTPLVSLVKGAVCLVKYFDGDWYRGAIVDINEDNVEVWYCDYGNTEQVSRDWACDIPENLCVLPRQAFCASLEGVSPLNKEPWGVAETQKFDSLVFLKNVYATMHGQNEGVYKISLVDTSSGAEDIEIGEELVRFGGTKLDCNSAVAPQSPISSNLGALNNCVEVSVSEATNPSSFHVNLATRSYPQYLQQFTDHYKKLVSNNSPALQGDTHWKIGSYCAANIFNVWIRGRILHMDEDNCSVKVINIDQGKQQDIPISSLKPLIVDFLADPVYAVRCYLDGIEPIDGKEWPADATKFFYKLMSKTIRKQQTCFATVKGPQCKEDSSWPIEYCITDPSCISSNIKVTQLMITKGYARAIKKVIEPVNSGYIPLPVPVESGHIPVTIVHTTNNCMLFAQLDSNQDKLEEVQRSLDAIMEGYHKEEGDVLWEIGSCCVVKYPESDSGRWMRGIVSRLMGDYLVEINMVDTGIMHTFKKVDVHPILAVPHINTLALPCNLAHVQPAEGGGRWSVQASELVFEKTVREKCTIQVQENTSSTVSISLVLPGGSTLSDVLLAKGLAVPSSPRPPLDLVPGEDVDMKSVGVESANNSFSHFDII